MATLARPIGELDLHLFGEGTHRRLWELLGPQPLHRDDDDSARAIRFAVWAPNAVGVAVVGDWNDWAPEPLAPVVTDTATGIWSGVAPAARSGHRYRFEIRTHDGRLVRRTDPMARQTEPPPSDDSVVPLAAHYDWHDGDWMSARGATIAEERSLRIYEVHLGSWRRGAATWDELAAQVGDHVARLGFTHVELMPVAEHLVGGSWGYRVSSYFAPTARYGDPEGFRRFVDHLHGRGIGVILDWVPSRFPNDDGRLARFDGTPLYEHEDPPRGEHSDRETHVFDYGCNQVRNFLVANALYWIDQFHVDGLRVDAVESMLYLDHARGEGDGAPGEHGGGERPGALRFLRETTGVVGDEFPDAMMIAAASTAVRGVTAPISDGGLGFTHTWNVGWVHDTLGYLARDPGHRGHHHDELASALQDAHDERFVLPLGHDEVVDGKGTLLGRIGGDDRQRFAALRALYAWQWSLPGAPLLFMGSELAPWQEWYDESSPPWHLLDHAAHRGVHDLVAALNRAVDAWPALWRRDTDPGGFQWLDDAAHRLDAFLRWDVDGASAVACIGNFSADPRPGSRVGLPWGGSWEVVLDTDAVAWRGSGHRGDDPSVVADETPWQGQGSSAMLDVGPMSMLWLAARSPG